MNYKHTIRCKDLQKDWEAEHPEWKPGGVVVEIEKAAEIPVASEDPYSPSHGDSVRGDDDLQSIPAESETFGPIDEPRAALVSDTVLILVRLFLRTLVRQMCCLQVGREHRS